MTGWSGGAANREYRGPSSGRVGLVADVRRILAEFRKQRGWKPGAVWDPYLGVYVPAEAVTSQ